MRNASGTSAAASSPRSSNVSWPHGENCGFLGAEPNVKRPRGVHRTSRRNGSYLICFFPTCQVRVVRFYVSCLLLLLLLLRLLRLLLPRPPPPPPRPPCHPCRPCRPRRPRRPCSTAIRDPQCSLPDLNHDHPRPVFPAGPQPRPSTPSVPCRTSTTTSHAQCSRTSTTTIHAQCSLPDLHCEHPRQVFPAGPHVVR